MTAPELIELTGVTLNSIKGVHRRKNHVGFSQKEDLPQDVVDHFLTREGMHETDPAQPVAAKVEPKQTKPKRKPAKKVEPNQGEPKEQTELEPTKKIEPEPTRTEQPEPNQPVPIEPFDLGNWLFFHPTAQFSYVLALILVQAWIFASLSSRVFSLQDNHLPVGAMLMVGVLVESSGVMISKAFKPSRFGDNSPLNLWLFIFLAWQILVDLSYFRLLGSGSDIIGQYVVSMSVPIGILAYSSLYFKKK